MLSLRPYQQTAVQKAIDYFNSPDSEAALIVLPTAWGKSILTAFVAAHIPDYEKLLVVQPSKELLEQNYNKYIALCGNEAKAGIYSASFGKKQVERITYATIGSIKELGNLFKQQGFTKMLIDEAHLYPREEESMLGKFLKDSGIRQVLGITATPLKLEQFEEKIGNHFDKWSQLTMLTNISQSGTFFKKILHVGQIQEMTAMKWWSPLKYEIIPFNPKDLNLNSTGNEYTKDSEALSYVLNNIRENIYGALNYHRNRRHCLVFVPSVEEAELLSRDYPDSAYISGSMKKKERTQVINSFREGKIRVIFNVGVLSTGFDYPKIDMILLGFSTASVAKYYQILGRGVRVDMDGWKKDCIIIDMGGNVNRFGRVEDIRFEKTDRWRMYGTNEILLTGLPIDMIGTIHRQDIQRIYSCRYPVPNWTFGKYNGKPLDAAPFQYMKWAVMNMESLSLQFCDCIIRTMENHVRDTRNEPPVVTIPDGAHAGELLKMIPRNYLAWYYNQQNWNECNDSLKRGIELAYGGIPPYFKSKRKTA